MKKTKKAIPEFKDIQEMAEFWDTHDSTEVELGEVEDVHYEPKKAILSVRFDVGDMVKLGRAARRLGMDRSTLVRAIVKQYLNNNGEEACVMERGPDYGRPRRHAGE
ncbi:MAG: CopG antitoxin of type toxin-antitoxin system [Bacillota bacterium]|nr:CopG antitoxin of type toxin-antitoxin system [Bacillota bacterium]